MFKDLTDVVGLNTFLGEPAHLLVDSRSQTADHVTPRHVKVGKRGAHLYLSV